MRWIPCAERLPDPGIWVLVWTGEYYWIAQIDPLFGENLWVGVYENEYWCDPTHWQTLPVKP